MNTRERAQILLAIAAICILLTSCLPLLFKTLFVDATGHMEAFSPWIAGLIFFAYAYRQPWVEKLALIFCCISATMLLIVVIGLVGLGHGKVITNSFLLFLQIVTILILRDKEVKSYLRNYCVSQS
jgi:hypothetical protein